MASQAQGQADAPAGALLALIAADGVAAHPYLGDDAAFAGPDGARDLADFVHYLCILHCGHPGVIDHAEEVTACPASRAWLAAVAPAFTAERLYIARLAVAVGPVPSTPGSAESEAAVGAQCHALETLARSERRGCSLGAAVALVLDWRAFRRVLDQAAERFGVEVPRCGLPDAQTVAAVVDAVADALAVRRAMGFGASQVLVQHRGLLDLLDARRGARRDS